MEGGFVCDRIDVVPQKWVVWNRRRVKVRDGKENDLRLPHGRVVMWKKDAETAVKRKGS